jgi:hypothetical protein
MNAAPHKYRAASGGKIFTRKERINIVLHKRAESEAAANRRTLVMEEKNRIAKEREAKQTAAKVRAALLANPGVKKINQKKDGTLYFQPRVNGKIGPAVIVG